MHNICKICVTYIRDVSEVLDSLTGLFEQVERESGVITWVGLVTDMKKRKLKPICFDLKQPRDRHRQPDRHWHCRLSLDCVKHRAKPKAILYLAQLKNALALTSIFQHPHLDASDSSHAEEGATPASLHTAQSKSLHACHAHVEPFKFTGPGIQKSVIPKLEIPKLEKEEHLPTSSKLPTLAASPRCTGESISELHICQRKIELRIHQADQAVSAHSRDIEFWRIML
jgi:hypothetical protein